MTTVVNIPKVTDEAGRNQPETVPVTLIDCDVHPSPAASEEILEFLPRRWHHLESYVPVPFRMDTINNASRLDARPSEDRRAGSDPALLERQLFEDAGVDFAVLMTTGEPLRNPDADAARAAAINEWMASLWLGDYNHHGRFRGSLRIPMHNPGAAIKEIEKWGDDPRFVQVVALYPYSPAFGHPMYEPILRAAAVRGLPVAIHPSNAPVWEGTPVGAETYFFEWHAGAYPYSYAAHLASLVCNGVFERIQNLKFVMTEGGIAWTQALADHLDRNWRHLKEEVPELKCAPSEYLQRGVVFTTQPVEEPRNVEALTAVYTKYAAEERILFATDYPHWDYDSPIHALPPLPDAAKRSIMVEAAASIYDLPLERAVD